MKKGTLIILRGLLGVVLCGTAYPSMRNGELNTIAYILLFLYIISIVVTFLWKSPVLKNDAVAKGLFIFDIASVTLLSYFIGEKQQEFYVVLFLTILLSAAARSKGAIIITPILAAALYTWLTINGKTGVELLSFQFNIRTALFFVASVFIEYMAQETYALQSATNVLRSKYKSIIEKTSQGVVILDTLLSVMDVNNRAIEMFCFRKDAHNKRLQDILSKENLIAFRTVFDNVLKNNIYAAELEIKDGNTVKTLEINVHRVDEETETYYQVFAKDITHSKELKAHIQQIERLGALGEFVGGIAHELSNPMTSVVGFSQLLMNTKDENKKQEYAEKIYSEAVRVSNIIKGFIYFSGKLPIEKALVDINKLCSEALSIWGNTLYASNIKIVGEFDKHIPQIEIDPSKLKEVIISLINNARESILKMGAQKGEIILSTQQTNGNVKISISDTGTGISQEYINYVFDPFFTTKPPPKDLGLGLSASYGIIKEHGGNIYVQNNKKTGATFTIELPILQEA